jgi:hypothetical protein
MKALLAILLFLMCRHEGKSQHQSTDLPVNDVTFHNNFSKFQKSLGENLVLYNGKEHIPYPRTMKGSPYFRGNDFHKGAVFYDGVFYQEIDMQYDLVRDALVTLHANRVFKFELVSELMDYFLFEGKKFVRLVRTGTGNDEIRNGFYQLLYDGPTKLYAKHKNRISENKSNESTFLEVISTTRYIVKKSDQYYTLQRPRSIYKLFRQQKKEIRKNLKGKKLSLKHNPEEMLAEIARQYDIIIGNAK